MKGKQKQIAFLDNNQILLDSILVMMPDYIDCHVFTYTCFSCFKAEDRIFDLIVSTVALADCEEIQLIQKIRQIHQETPILIVGTFEDNNTVNNVFSLGANGYINKSCSFDVFVKAIFDVMKGGTVCEKGIETVLNRKKISNNIKLTKREQQVLNLIAKQYTSKEMAVELELSEHTILSFRKNLLNKFSVNKTVGVLMKARELNFI